MYITQGLATAALHGVTSPFQAALPGLSTPQTTQSHRELWTPQQLQVHIGRQTEQQFHCLHPIYITQTLSKGIFHHKGCRNSIFTCAIHALKLENCFWEVHLTYSISTQHKALNHYMNKPHTMYFFLLKCFGLMHAYLRLYINT